MEHGETRKQKIEIFMCETECGGASSENNCPFILLSHSLQVFHQVLEDPRDLCWEEVWLICRLVLRLRRRALAACSKRKWHNFMQNMNFHRVTQEHCPLRHLCAGIFELDHRRTGPWHMFFPTNMSFQHKTPLLLAASSCTQLHARTGFLCAREQLSFHMPRATIALG